MDDNGSWLPACCARPHGSFAQASRRVWKFCSRVGRNPRAHGCCEVEPDYLPAAEEPRGVSGMDTSSGGKKPKVTKDPWATTGCPGGSAHVGNANGQDKWEGRTGRGKASAFVC
jgi:hypothetical protein